MLYALNTIVRELNRFLPAIIAVASCSMLMFLQGGIIRGILDLISAPIDHASADLWIGHPAANSLERGQPIPERWLARVASQKEVLRAEPYLFGNAILSQEGGGETPVTVIGVGLDENSLGATPELTPAMRRDLREPGTVVAAHSEVERIGLARRGIAGSVSGRRVRVVGWTKELKGLAGPYLFCSVETARLLLPGVSNSQATYLLASCRSQKEAKVVAQRLRKKFPGMTVYTKSEFSQGTQLFWFTQTQAGTSIVFVVLLGMAVGVIVTSQTLYAATAASRKEYAVLDALGIPRWRMGWAVFCQSFWVGVGAVLVALPVSYLVTWGFSLIGVPLVLQWWILALGAALTIITALVSGLIAMRSLLLIEPAELLH